MRRKKKQNLHVTLEVCYDDLHLAVCEVDAEHGVSVRTGSARWRESSRSLDSEKGISELTAGIKSLLSKFGVSGQTVQLALNGDLCVTRVVTGSKQDVAKELGQLEQRSTTYHGLGHGPKSLAECIRSVDAKRRHALLTVVNQETVEALMEATSNCGLNMSLIEPSIVSLGRTVSKVGGDQNDPAIIVSIDSHGNEVGISHNGHILLDYRSREHKTQSDFAHSIVRHLSRLQRYCDRHIRYKNGELKRFFVRGPQEQAIELAEALRELQHLPVAILDPLAIDHAWEFAEIPKGSLSSAALGVFLRKLQPEDEQFGPNLLERATANMRQPWSTALAKTMWPVAAALLLTAGVLGGRMYEQSQLNTFNEQYEVHELEQRQIALLRTRMVRDQTKINHLRDIRHSLSNLAWHEITTTMGQCLPPDAWIDSIEVDDGRLTLNGATYTEAGPFDLVRNLHDYGVLSEVSLAATRPIRLQAGPAYQYSIECKINDYNENKDSGNGKS